MSFKMKMFIIIIPPKNTLSPLWAHNCISQPPLQLGVACSWALPGHVSRSDVCHFQTRPINNTQECFAPLFLYLERLQWQHPLEDTHSRCQSSQQPWFLNQSMEESFPRHKFPAWTFDEKQINFSFCKWLNFRDLFFKPQFTYHK